MTRFLLTIISPQDPRTVKEWFEVKKVSQKENPLFLATSALEEENILHKDLICPPPEEKFLKLKLKKTNHQQRAIGTLHATIRTYHFEGSDDFRIAVMRPNSCMESPNGTLLVIGLFQL
jgi:hypothetical protein